MGKRRCGFGVVEAEGQSEVMRERNQTAEKPIARVRGADQPVDTRGDSGEDSGKGAQEEADNHRVGHFGDDIVFAALMRGRQAYLG